MRRYNKITVKIGGMFEHDIEIWSEHGHSSVYSGESPLFDGSSIDAHIAIKNEVERLKDIATKYGMVAEVIGKF